MNSPGTIRFCKFHGFGNDYIVIEKDELKDAPPIAELAISICDRHRGAGADGIAVIEKLNTAKADYFCEIINPDGSIAGFSGNGTRCAVAYLFHKELWSEHALRLKTRSGVKNYRMIEKIGDRGYWFEAEIGKPLFTSGDVPVLSADAKGNAIRRPISVGVRKLEFSAVNVGNPVACIFVDDFDFNWRSIGRQMEMHDVFPERANIVFVRVIDAANIELRIWERGAGETASSGTCCSGAAVLSAVMEKTGRHVSVHTVGGITDVNWRDDDEILLTGRADLAYCGEWYA
jgi:diaminopimelate epimerase